MLKPSEILFAYIFSSGLVSVGTMDLFIHCHVSSVACIKKICFSWNHITLHWNLKHCLCIVILCSFNYIYGFSFGYYTHTYFLYMCIHIFTVAYPCSTWSGYLTCSGIFIDMCDIKIWLVYFTWEQLCFCCAVWHGFQICGAICIWCLWSQFFFFNLIPIMFLLYCVALWWFSDLCCYLPMVFVISICVGPSLRCGLVFVVLLEVNLWMIWLV